MAASDRGWGDPGSPGSVKGQQYRRDHIIEIRAGGIRLWVHRGVAHLFQGFINEIVARGYRVDDVADDWGYNHRYIRGQEAKKILSNHSWGLAIDLNAVTNPQGRVLRTDMPDWVVEAATRWGFYWGGNYKTTPDAMHFEFLGRPEDVHRFPTVSLSGKKEDEMSLACGVPWPTDIAQLPGRTPFFELRRVLEPNAVMVVSYNHATFHPPFDLARPGDELTHDGFYSRTFTNLTGPALAIEPIDTNTRVAVLAAGGGVYEVAKKP